MRSLIKAFARTDRPWLVITAGLLLFTLYDIYDHISRPGSSFEENSMRWIFFSLSSVVTIIGVMFLTAQLLQKMAKRFDVVTETLGLLFATVFHIYFSGPLYNRLFWSDEDLIFQFNLVPVLIICGIYLFLRLVVYNGLRYFLKSRRRTDV